jgi:endonuclease-3
MRRSGQKAVIPTTPKASTTRAKAAPRFDPGKLRAHAAEVFEALSTLYPDAHCELDYQNAFQLLVATILSAQCRSARQHGHPVLFAKYPDPSALAAARQEEVEAIIRSTGFFGTRPET